MTTVSTFLAVLWIIFWAYWLISAVRSKRNIRNGAWARGFAVRLCILLLVIWFFRVPNVLSLFAIAPGSYANNVFLEVIGVVMWFAGVGLAIWARVYLGRNWGMPMSLKQDPELVTSGPYRYVRHPIYSGILLAVAGTALVGSFFWVIVFVSFLLYFIYSAFVEEKNMARLFPDQYPAYKKRTKMLIPFVL